VDKAHAQYRALKAKEDGGIAALRLDVELAHAEYLEAREAMNTALQMQTLARQWLQEALDEYDFEPETLDDLVTAFESYAQLERSYHESVYDHNLALAKLEETTGVMALSSLK
jgi:outer membrane protein TolC